MVMARHAAVVGCVTGNRFSTAPVRGVPVSLGRKTLPEARMSSFLSAYLVALVLLTAIDLVWLGLVARGFYVAQLGDLMRPQPGLVAAALFYAVYAAGVVQFAVMPGLRRRRLDDRPRAGRAARPGRLCHL